MEAHICVYSCCFHLLRALVSFELIFVLIDEVCQCLHEHLRNAYQQGKEIMESPSQRWILYLGVLFFISCHNSNVNLASCSAYSPTYINGNLYISDLGSMPHSFAVSSKTASFCPFRHNHDPHYLNRSESDSRPREPLIMVSIMVPLILNPSALIKHTSYIAL